MPEVSKIFPATSDSFHNTMTSQGGKVGFRIPEYQRTYDWNKVNIKRLLEDCLNGFSNLSTSGNESYTFLGTLILVKEESEPTFDGTSLSVVDGQQRLTSLLLLCCVLIEELYHKKEDVQHLEELTENWIKSELDYIHERLFECISGQLTKLGKMVGFPRVVRVSEDKRGFKDIDAQYRSIIAKFLNDFYNHYIEGNSDFKPVQVNENADTLRFMQNYEYIKAQVELGIYKGFNTSDVKNQSDLDFNRIEHNDFRNAGLWNLFVKLDTFTDQGQKDNVISNIASNSNSSGFIRLILFSHYVLKLVILTRIESSDEDAAFDIFDSLNTTGEPLTAIETFKPRVIAFEREKGNNSFSDTESAIQFDRIEENLNYVFMDNDKRQKETRELLVTYALYLEGRKLPENLVSQRSYLRTKFDEAENSDTNRSRIIQALADIAEFRQTYWNQDSIRTLNSFHQSERCDILKLCCAFISEMKTSLALPIMARYWKHYQKNKDEETFIDAVMALTAFLVLWRSITGTTGGIDSIFRKIMGKLCIGLDVPNTILSSHDFRKMLRDYLAVSRLGVKDENTWVPQVCEVPLALYSKPLCRFLHFAASNNSIADQVNRGLLTRDDIIQGDQLSYLNFDKWQDSKYATVEHVAPDSNPGIGWDQKIYDSSYTRHTIGNTILLPQKENSSVGNSPWKRKQLFYRALSAKTKSIRKAQFEQAKQEGLTFKKRTESLLNRQERLDMLDPIADLDEWTDEIIRKRTRNILELAWDELAPWLNY